RARRRPERASQSRQARRNLLQLGSAGTMSTPDTAGIGQLDHVALGVHDMDERIAFLTGTLGMTLKRMGTHFKSGGRIAMIADANGFKLELIELPNDAPGLQHVAYRVEDVDAAYGRLIEAGCSGIRGPHELGAAKAVTALV